MLRLQRLALAQGASPEQAAEQGDLHRANHAITTGAFGVHPVALKDAFDWYIKKYKLEGNFDDVLRQLKSFKKQLPDGLVPSTHLGPVRYARCQSRAVVFPPMAAVRASVSSMGYWVSADSMLRMGLM